jgi:diguanylate cyclase (GGDEF)-like protein
VLKVRSFSIWFILTAVGAVTITFAVFIGLVLFQLHRNLERQKEELERFTDNKLTGILDADVVLAASRLKFLTNDIARRVQGIAMRADTVAAIGSRNMVALEAVLDPAARAAEVDTIVAVDTFGNVIGASIRNADLVAVDSVVQSSAQREDLIHALAEADRADPVVLSSLAKRETFSEFLDGTAGNASKSAGLVSQIVMTPVFDDFGEVTGGLIAQRWLRASEPILKEFAEITGSGIAVYADSGLVSAAALAPDILFKNQGARLIATAGQDEFIARCAPTLGLLTVCAFKPISELFAAQDELTRIATTEGRRLIQWLIGIGILSGVGMSAAIAATAVPIARPLRKLSRIVSAVAHGNYDFSVEHTDRADEIGEISRAVLRLQDSVRERDNLRASIVVKNAALERQEVELRNQNVLFDAALNNMSHGLCMFDRSKCLIVANRRYSEMFGIDPDRLKPGLHQEALLDLQTLVSEGNDEAEETENALHPADWPADRRSSVTQRLTDSRVILTTRQPLSGGGWVVIYEDVTERHKARERLVHQANFDSLTKLPNRVRLRSQLRARLELIKQNPGTCFGVFCIDLDQFKVVNDTLGHPTGDLLLQQVAGRLVGVTRKDDLVVRLGGDEFAVLTQVGTRSDLAGIPERLIEAIGAPYDLCGQAIIAGASIGVAIAPYDGHDADQLMQHADLALYQAKSEGRNTFRYFRPEMAESVRERQQVITDLRNAIESGELVVHFQPVWNLDDRSIAGFEALVRWQHPVHGLISPGNFIPIAEETGLIIPIGEQVLREACQHAVRWPVPVRVAVNVSARQVRDRAFAVMVVNALAATGLPATRLELEITESVLLQDNEETRATLLQLKSLGIRIAMDDFGTGYSSLSCLRSFPFDKIKIDQSFVKAMSTSGEASSIVSAIIELAGNLNIATTAEGIEDEATLNVLARKGCREGQGFYLGRPHPPSVALQLLNELAGSPAVLTLELLRA